MILKYDFFFYIFFNFRYGNTYLFHRVAVTHRYAVIRFGIEIVGDAKGRSYFILTAIAFAD